MLRAVEKYRTRFERAPVFVAMEMSLGVKRRKQEALYFSTNY
jgi:hypothetical protein